MSVVLVTTDLMATSAAEGAARAAGVELHTARPGDVCDSITQSTSLVALDLTAKVADLPALVATARDRAPQATLLAYGPHVHESRLAGARDSGFDLVVSRGQFHKQMSELFARYASDG